MSPGLRRLFRALCLSLLVLCIVPATGALAQPEGYEEYLHVYCKIDGSDWFEMTGDQWRWQHRNNSLPEYHDGTSATWVNDQSFLSQWPNGGGYLSYSAYNTVEGLMPIQRVFGPDVQVLVEKLDGRGATVLEQAPTADNGYTMRVFINDDSWGSHDYYEFKVYGQGSPVPLPGSVLLLGAGLVGVLLKKRRR